MARAAAGALARFSMCGCDLAPPVRPRMKTIGPMEQEQGAGKESCRELGVCASSGPADTTKRAWLLQVIYGIC